MAWRACARRAAGAPVPVPDGTRTTAASPGERGVVANRLPAPGVVFELASESSAEISAGPLEPSSARLGSIGVPSRWGSPSTLAKSSEPGAAGNENQSASPLAPLARAPVTYVPAVAVPVPLSGSTSGVADPSGGRTTA